MSSVIRAIWASTYGLLVDDGQMAVGIVVALAVVWALAAYGSETIRDSSGWILLALVVLLVLANLYRAGQNARRQRA